MALEIKQELRLSQQLVMTPQLQQAIKLLQLSRLELAGVVEQELQENPVLEETQDVEEERTSAQAAEAQLSDPEIYDRPEEVHRLATEHERARSRAATLMEEWTAAAEELEADGT